MSEGLKATFDIESATIQVVRVERARLLSTVGKASLVLACAAGGVGRVVLYGLTPFVVTGLAVTSGLAICASYFLTLRRTTVPCQVRLGAGWIEVQFGGVARRIESREVGNMLVVAGTSAGPVFVEIETAPAMHSIVRSRNRPGDILRIAVQDAKARQRMVETLGFARGRRVRVACEAPLRRSLNVALASASYLLGLGAIAVAIHVTGVGPVFAYLFGISASPIVALMIYAIAKHVFRPLQFVVGDDGFIVRRGYRECFVPMGSVAAIEEGAAIPSIRLTNESHVPLRGIFLDRDRIQTALALIQAGGAGAIPRSSRFSAYGRNRRSIEEWCKDIRVAFDGTDYRSSASSIDEAGAVLASAVATSEERMGAAIALRVSGAKDRLRVATDGLADDHLRLAIEAIADADDEVDIATTVRRFA